MNDDFSKMRFKQDQAEHSTHLQQAKVKQEPREFASVEEMIRTDRDETEVPPKIAERLNDSIAKEPPPPKSWWKRFFGTSD